MIFCDEIPVFCDEIGYFVTKSLNFVTIFFICDEIQKKL